MKKADREKQKADQFIAQALMDALGSVRAEGIEPSDHIVNMVEQAARGEISFDDVLKSVRERPV